MANWITSNHNFPCDDKLISHWRKRKRLPTPNADLFPLPKPPNLFDISEVDEWCRRYLKSGIQIELFAKERIDRAQARIKEVEAENAERENSSKFCETATAENFLSAAYIQDCHLIDKLIEDRDGIRRLVQETGTAMGLTPEQLADMDARLVPVLKAANDALKNQFNDGTATLVGRAVEAKKQT